MLGTTAGRLFWMFRNLERSENTARLLEAGLRIALTRSAGASTEWRSVIAAVGSTNDYEASHGSFTSEQVIDYLLRDQANPVSVRSVVNAARESARGIRTALTREVWEATNESWMTIMDMLAAPLRPTQLPSVLRTIKQESAYVRGAMLGTMTRNERYDFARLGTFVERADNTARILDVKYFLLLPSPGHVGSRLDTLQWETILRAASAQRAYRWKADGQINPSDIAEFIMLDPQLPRSLLFCCRKIVNNLGYLALCTTGGERSQQLAADLLERVEQPSISEIFDYGLHEFLTDQIVAIGELSTQIERDFRFYA